MNRCQDKIRDLLPEFVHGLLEPEEMIQVADHLENCGECALEVSVFRLLQTENIPEPPPWFWTSLAGKVTDQVDARRKRKMRLLVPAWAGGFITAVLALFIFLWPAPVAQLPTDLNEYALVEPGGTSYLGLEEEILSVSGTVIVDLDRPLILDIGTFSEEYMAASDLIPGGDGYETMDEITMRVFEDLLEKMTPEGVRKKVMS